MKWQRIPLGPLQTNSYILSSQDKKCIIFDPGGDFQKLRSIISEQNLQPTAILLTHAHFDHIGAVDQARSEWNIPVYLHEKEKKWLRDPALNGSAYFFPGHEISISDANEIIKIEGEIEIGAITLKVLFTPGHSPGSISFYCKEIGVIFSGDALFAGSIGRTDLTGGNHEQLLKSIHDKLLTLPEETIVLSGHGPETTIEAEMNQNPFLNGF